MTLKRVILKLVHISSALKAHRKAQKFDDFSENINLKQTAINDKKYLLSLMYDDIWCDIHLHVFIRLW